jgi:hypothetical protein
MLTFHRTALGRLLVICWFPDHREVCKLPAFNRGERHYTCKWPNLYKYRAQKAWESLD